MAIKKPKRKTPPRKGDTQLTHRIENQETDESLDDYLNYLIYI